MAGVGRGSTVLLLLLLLGRIPLLLLGRVCLHRLLLGTSAHSEHGVARRVQLTELTELLSQWTTVAAHGANPVLEAILLDVEVLSRLATAARQHAAKVYSEFQKK